MCIKKLYYYTNFYLNYPLKASIGGKHIKCFNLFNNLDS